ncbi:hypothetical protein SAMN05443661_12426 [Natronobacterium gregoryi]|uniref:Uncharacterized protein n=2 Tax=Natronobacterium gregoryi TaxID=44930 RepID=L0AC60_NATGS|nr:hypothetical protein Natgr_0194 [Natronobacterium gregoryi SP2]SFJ36215.1 hypothetical protein SAMN05443661_12426 [Natronobacterium gregoryi]
MISELKFEPVVLYYSPRYRTDMNQKRSGAVPIGRTGIAGEEVT